MQIVFDRRFHEVYTSDPAAALGRLGPAEKRLRGLCDFAPASPARVDDILRVHTERHLREIRADEVVYDMAMLAAGSALAAARSALAGEPAFALLRPPGHHASPDSCWGFCFFNNVAVALAALLDEGAIGSACVLDIDLHFGDGSERIFRSLDQVEYLHPEGSDRIDYLAACRSALERARPFDLLAISAGFDRHECDWGGMLRTGDYEDLGQKARAQAEKHCNGKWFGVLEGGYNPSSLAKSTASLLGLSQESG
ncbi:MAG: histone deacetylase family protein [Deltaproteobacteria bacterium]|nr:histone deacetylase family protein [Deltaproteobacteria bacterium]